MEINTLPTELLKQIFEKLLIKKSVPGMPISGK